MGQIARISSRGQLVIPAELRKKYRLLPRTTAVFGESNGKLTLESSALSDVLALRGCLSHVKEDIEAVMMEERRKDRDRDEKKFAEYS